MNLFTSKLLRSIVTNFNNFHNAPKKCYAMFYLPHSKNDVCDCVNICKYQPPPANANIDNIQKKYDYNYNYYEEKVA